MCGMEANSSEGGKDLGVTIIACLKFFQPCNEATIKPNGILGFIKRHFSLQKVKVRTNTIHRYSVNTSSDHI